MADQLATPADLASLLQQDVDTATATLLLECATAVVQEAAGGQRLLEVVGDTANLTGLTDSWLDLPQIPVTAVISVTLDGVAVAAGTPGSGGLTYRRRGNRLWRGGGWQTYCGEPSDVVVVHTHGYAVGAQQLQLARSSVLSLAKPYYPNPSGASSESIDDYSVTYAAMSAQMEATPIVKAALRKTYGRRAGFTRIG